MDQISHNETLWNNFILNHSATMSALELPKITGNQNNTIAMIEPRSHPHISFVLRNALRFLGPEWDIDIFIGRNNTSFMTEVTADLGNVNLHPLMMDDLSVIQYNTLKKQPDIWNTIKAENILWMEPDCLICRPGIEQYMKYDYIGAPWHPDFAISPSCQIGNGGFSFRKRTAMLEVAHSANHHHHIFLSEDVYFVLNMMMRNKSMGIKTAKGFQRTDTYHLPSIETAQSFAVESVFHPQPFGLHKSWKYLPTHQLEYLLSRISM